MVGDAIYQVVSRKQGMGMKIALKGLNEVFEAKKKTESKHL